MQLLAGKGKLRRDLTVDTATDALLVTFSDSAYVQLTQERGWSHDAVVEWFCASLPRVLLADPPGSEPPPTGPSLMC